MSGAVTPPPQPGNYTLLVVDDVEDNRDLLERRFVKKGFAVVTAADGDEALRRVEAGGISLIVLDINMPGTSGLDVLRRLRADPALANLPIIMATARSESEHIVEALDLGATDYVTKPIDFPVLNARVIAALRKVPPSTQVETDLGPGSTLSGRYRLDRSIGRGGFGEVFRATHLDLNREVAVKVLRVPANENDALARFKREGINACQVQHPNAVAVLDSGISAAGIPYLVMELLDGHSLDKELVEFKLSPRRSIQIIVAVCQALATAHALNIIHRDIKPENIFLHGAVPKLLDFGLAKLIGTHLLEQKITMEGWMIGTPMYMAPERFAGSTYTGKSDVYSIGVILHQMLTDSMPFQVQTEDPVALAHLHAKSKPVPLRDLSPDLPKSLEALLLRTLSKTPEDRPSAAELAQELSLIAMTDLPKGQAPRTQREARDLSLSVSPTESFEAPKQTPAAPVAPTPAEEITVVLGAGAGDGDTRS